MVTQTLASAINELNAIFQNSGTASGEIPAITSSLAISLVEGETLNYELTDNYGTEYEWDTSAVSGVVVSSDNRRKIIGGSSLAAGTYNIPVKAINYNGEDSETIVLTVSTPPFANTKSVQFNNLDYLGANAALLDGILGRSGNGSGASDGQLHSGLSQQATLLDKLFFTLVITILLIVAILMLGFWGQMTT